MLFLAENCSYKIGTDMCMNVRFFKLEGTHFYSSDSSQNTHMEQVYN